MMNTIIPMLLCGLAAHEGIIQIAEISQRRDVFAQARSYSDSVNKPLLVVGTPQFVFYHPCGDVTIDIDPKRIMACGGEIADVRDIPYSSKYFGAAFCSHILEHLDTIDDALKAFGELKRVADEVFIVLPHKSSLIAWLTPNHHLWIKASEDGYLIEQR